VPPSFTSTGATHGQPTTVKVGKEDVVLDPALLKFDEHTINDYLSREAGLYSYFAAKWADAAYVAARYEDRYETTLAGKFREFKEQQATDKMADSMAKSDPEVVDLRDKVRMAKRVKDHLYMYLKSIDKNHENALNTGYNLRREMNLHGTNSVRTLAGPAKTLDEIIN
jgi:hypothetical protein